MGLGRRHGGFSFARGRTLHPVRTYRRNHIVVRRPCRHVLVRIGGTVNRRGIQRGRTLPSGGGSPVDVVAHHPGGRAGGPGQNHVVASRAREAHALRAAAGIIGDGD